MVYILSKVFLLALIGFILGMLNPDWGIFWGDYSVKSRKNVIKYYGILALFSFTLGIYFTDQAKSLARDVDQLEETEPINIENYGDNNKEVDLSKLSFGELIQNNSFKDNIEKVSYSYFKDFEKIENFKFSLGNIQVFQEHPVKDSLGTLFKYSFLVDGYYQLEDQEKDKSFSILIAYRNKEDLNQGLASCIKYNNKNTGIYFNALEK